MKYVRGNPAFEELKLITKPSKPAFATPSELFDIVFQRSKRFKILLNPGGCVFVRTKYGIKEISTAASNNLSGELLVSIG